jgi:hypothetical protein
MNDYLSKEEIKHPSFSCYFYADLILSQFKKPIFTLQKCERLSFIIIDKIDINVLTAFNCLFYEVIKERDNFDVIAGRKRKEIPYLTLNKLYLIEDVFEEFNDFHCRKIKLLLTDKKNIFIVMLPKRFNTLSEEHEQLFKSKTVCLIYEGKNIYNDYEIKFECLNNQPEQLFENNQQMLKDQQMYEEQQMLNNQQMYEEQQMFESNQQIFEPQQLFEDQQMIEERQMYEEQQMLKDQQMFEEQQMINDQQIINNQPQQMFEEQQMLNNQQMINNQQNLQMFHP